MFFRNTSSPEIKPEKTSIKMRSDGSSTEITVTPALTTAQKQAFWSTMQEVVDRGLVPWARLPKHARHSYAPDGTSNSKYDFPNSHFGSFAEVQAEIGVRTLYGVLEQDGIEFDSIPETV